ncbi:hypothetical protein SVAN01_01369 [Stagonosporopsis vannaccii]|nr:hypothetical protein SVAN01_01369 [Stagonosporopsis vannaccii]
MSPLHLSMRKGLKPNRGRHRRRETCQAENQTRTARAWILEAGYLRKSLRLGHVRIALKAAEPSILDPCNAGKTLRALKHPGPDSSTTSHWTIAQPRSSPQKRLSHGAETSLPASPRKVLQTYLISVVAGRVVFPFQTRLLSRRHHD